MKSDAARPAAGAPLRRHVVAAFLSFALTGCTAGGTLTADAIEAPRPVVFLDTQRGEQLYDTQCVSCHTTQAHWRDNSIVGSWADVLAQVGRWQENTGQQWTASEIGDVAAYLNSVYYKMSCPTPGCRGNSTAAANPDIGAALVD